MGLLLGCIADDLTGGTDLANALVRSGMRTMQAIGVPDAGLTLPDADAIVVALKSRTIPVDEAVAHSLASLRWLRAAGARQFYFKYCSTFDSTDAGNIGPVADALLDALGEGFTIVCPAFPENGRTVYQGYLFVGSQLLAESPMRHHPLTPMTDSSLARILGRQTQRTVAVVPYATVRRGTAAIAAALAKLKADGAAYAVTDILETQDLHAVGAACADLRLVTGGSGVALGLPANFRKGGLLPDRDAPAPLPRLPGPAAVIAGSSAAATLQQVAEMARTHPARKIDPLALAAGENVVGEALEWARSQLGAGRPILIHAGAPPDEVARVQAALGRERAGVLVEEALAEIARSLVETGVRKLVVAGGETAGAVVNKLALRALRIGPQIDPGVPWTVSLEDPPIALALKSGNFGGPDFFLKALSMLP